MGVAAHRRLLASTVAGLLAALTVSCSSSANQSAPQGSESPPQRPDFTQVTESMLLDASAIPDASDWYFTGPLLNSDGNSPSDDGVDPPECAPLYSGLPHAQKGVVSWVSTVPDSSDLDTPGQTVNLLIAVPIGRPDVRGLRDVLGKCGTFHAGELTSTASPPLQPPGLTDSAVAWRWDTPGPYASKGVQIVGLSRGLYVEISTYKMNGDEISPTDIDMLVKLFNDQVAKLQATD
jgi:hypothetical protein